MTRIRVTREVHLPDPVRLARSRRVPELGPRLLFFSGGSALRDLSRVLVAYTHNSIHLITPFDSGGSSAKLRAAFRMLAVGDLRNRLMALADRSVQGQPEIFSLFAQRLPQQDSPDRLERYLRGLVTGRDALIRAVPDPMRKIICNHLRVFHERKPPSFDLRGANVGNLILTGGFLMQSRHIDPVIFLFSRLVEVRGVVRPTTSENLHLAAELEDGRVVLGQHRITGKEEPPLSAPVKRMILSGSRRRLRPVAAELQEKVAGLIRQADAICFPMGSFYTSVLANLLVSGVGREVARRDVPKIYIPNRGEDPEMVGLPLHGAVRGLIRALRASDAGRAPTGKLLGHVLVDGDDPGWPPGDLDRVRDLGVRVIEAPLVTPESAPLLDPERVAEVLVSLA